MSKVKQYYTDEVEKKVDDILEQLGLTKVADNQVSSL